MFNKTKTSAGFSLLELLVVVSIIGIIISMLAVSFGTAQIKARDSKRRSDIKALQNAFEQYYAKNVGYNATCANMQTGEFLPAGAPTDPLTGTAFTCTSTTTTYCVCAMLEESGKGNATSDATSATCNFGGGAGANFYCLSNLQ